MIETRECKWCYTVGTEAVYPFPVRFLAAEDIRCFLLQNGEERELTAGTEFRVEVKADYSTGANITLLLDPLPQGATLAILRDTPVKQLLSLPEFGKLPASGLEQSLDKLTMIVQELSEVAGRCIKVPVTNREEDPGEVYRSIQTAPEFAEKAEEFAAEASRAVVQIKQMMDNPYRVRAGFGDRNPGYLDEKIGFSDPTLGGLFNCWYNESTGRVELFLTTGMDGLLMVSGGVLSVLPLPEDGKYVLMSDGGQLVTVETGPCAAEISNDSGGGSEV